MAFDFQNMHCMPFRTFLIFMISAPLVDPETHCESNIETKSCRDPKCELHTKYELRTPPNKEVMVINMLYVEILPK